MGIRILVLRHIACAHAILRARMQYCVRARNIACARVNSEQIGVLVQISPKGPQRVSWSAAYISVTPKACACLWFLVLGHIACAHAILRARMQYCVRACNIACAHAISINVRAQDRNGAAVILKGSPTNVLVLDASS